MKHRRLLRRTFVPRGSPPTTYWAQALMEGRPGALGAMLLGTAIRSVLIAPGIYAVGVRGPDIWKGALISSAFVSGNILLGYSLGKYDVVRRRRRRVRLEF